MAECISSDDEISSKEFETPVQSKYYQKDVSQTGSSDEEDCEGKVKLDCAVCLQNCIHPARLPCGHIFCYLCLKGIAHGNKKCAMCRHPIPPNYLENPDLIESPSSQELNSQESEGYRWFYEGRSGWWQYDKRAAVELEKAWLGGDEICDLLIAGYLYTVDLKSMVQSRRSEPGRRRKVKRDLASCPKKGIAGIRRMPDICEAIAKLRVDGQ